MKHKLWDRFKGELWSCSMLVNEFVFIKVISKVYRQKIIGEVHIVLGLEACRNYLRPSNNYQITIFL